MRKKKKKIVIFECILQELAQQFADGKSLSEHLQLPIQRINDYQLLLKVCIFVFI